MVELKVTVVRTRCRRWFHYYVLSDLAVLVMIKSTHPLQWMTWNKVSQRSLRARFRLFWTNLAPFVSWDYSIHISTTILSDFGVDGFS